MSEKELRKYNCRYCGRTIERYVGSAGGGFDELGRREQKVSSQVKCDCGNFLKTWDK